MRWKLSSHRVDNINAVDPELESQMAEDDSTVPVTCRVMPHCVPTVEIARRSPEAEL